MAVVVVVAVVVVEKVIVEVVGINIELYLVDAVADGDALPSPPPAQGQARHAALPWCTGYTNTPLHQLNHCTTAPFHHPPVSMPESGSEWLPLLLVSSLMPELESLGTRPRSHRRACAVEACRSFNTWGVVKRVMVMVLVQVVLQVLVVQVQEQLRTCLPASTLLCSSHCAALLPAVFLRLRTVIV